MLLARERQARGKVTAASIVLIHTQSGPGKVVNDTDLLKNKQTKQNTQEHVT